MIMEKIESLQHLQWEKAREIVRNIYENEKSNIVTAANKAIAEKEILRLRVLKVTDYLEKNDPMCKIEFIKDDEGKTFNIKLDFNPNLQPNVDAIMTTGESEIPVIETREEVQMQLSGVSSKSKALNQKEKKVTKKTVKH